MYKIVCAWYISVLLLYTPMHYVCARCITVCRKRHCDFFLRWFFFGDFFYGSISPPSLGWGWAGKPQRLWWNNRSVCGEWIAVNCGAPVQSVGKITTRTHGELFYKSYWIKSKSDCIYHAPIDFGTANGRCPFAVPNLSENSLYNLISVWFNKNWKIFLCVKKNIRCSRHNGGPDCGPPPSLKPLDAIVLWLLAGFQGVLNWAPTVAEKHQTIEWVYTWSFYYLHLPFFTITVFIFSPA